MLTLFFLTQEIYRCGDRSCWQAIIHLFIPPETGFNIVYWRKALHALRGFFSMSSG